MIAPERGNPATSTPFRNAGSIWERVLSPVSVRTLYFRRKLQTFHQEYDSCYFGRSPENRGPGPLLFLEREASVYLRKVFKPSPVTREQSPQLRDMRKRFFLEGFRSRLVSHREPVMGQVDVHDILTIMNSCGSPFEMEFTLSEAFCIYKALKSSQMNYRTHSVGSQTSSVHSLASPKYERRLLAPECTFSTNVSGCEDSGIDVSFDNDSQKVAEGSQSFYTSGVPQQYDFLKELTKINGYEVTSHLLSYLSPKDLQAVSSVGKLYRKIVESDLHANERRCNYVIERRFEKEKKAVASSKTNEDRVPFQNLGNKLPTVPKQPLANQNKMTIHDSFVEVAKKLHRSEVLMKCPNCCYPSRRINGSHYCCTRRFCSYEFCRDCSGTYSDDHKCQKFCKVKDIPNLIVGSVKSKRNLRRL